MLVNQSRMLTRQVSDTKREHTNLKTLVVQYKHEAPETRSIPELPPAEIPIPTIAPPVVAKPLFAPVATPTPITPPQQMA